MILAHVAGLPVEETIGTLGPAATVLLAVSAAYVRSVIRGRRRDADEDDR